MTDATATLAALGWRVSEEADSRGRPYFRAYRGGYVRGAHSLAALVAVVEATQQAIIEGEREAAILPLFRDEPLPTPQPTAPEAVQARLFEDVP